MVLFTVDSRNAASRTDSSFRFKFPEGGFPVVNSDTHYWTIGLISAAIPNVAPNVDPAIGTAAIEIKRNVGDAYTTFTLPTGRYDSSDIVAELHRQFYELGWYYGTATNPKFSLNIVPLKSINRFLIVLDDPANTGEVGATEYFVRFPSSGDGKNMHDLLGYSAAQEIQGSDSYVARRSTTRPDMGQGRDSYTINCNVIANSFVNNSYGQALYAFVPTVEAGLIESLLPPRVVRHQINRQKLSNIEFRLVDSLGRDISLGGDDITLNLEIKREKK